MTISEISRSLAKRSVGAVDGRKYFSVMILLVQGEGGEPGNDEVPGDRGLKILFEQRSKKMKTQPGDVCFPGGKIEPGESPLQCALRETEEEIGLSREKIRVLGQFDTLYEISDITMYTFCGMIEEKELANLRPNPAEVEKVFTVPYAFFRDEEPLDYTYDIVQKTEDFPYEEAGVSRDYRWRTGKKTIPVYHYGEGEERQIIWGMTGRIVSWFVSEMERAAAGHSSVSSNSRDRL